MERYFVTTKHPTGWQDGTHTFECKQDIGSGGWYAVAEGFGCSKTYATADRAIRAMCADHACVVTALVEIGGQS